MSAQTVDSTEASWRSSATTHAHFDAGTVPAPILTRDCRYRGLLGIISPRVEIYWSAPEGYTIADAELVASTNGLGSILEPITGFDLDASTTGTPTEYTTTIPARTLSGLIGAGTELEAAIYITEEDWTSEPASIIADPGIVAGALAYCENQ